MSKNAGFRENGSRINRGYCQDFALISYYFLKKHRPVIITAKSNDPFNGGHAFIKIKNKFYDAQFISGTRIAKNEGCPLDKITYWKRNIAPKNWRTFVDKKLINKVIDQLKGKK